MTLCIESYIGAEGVKLAEQLVVTDAGVEGLSVFPLQETLLA